MTLGPAFAADSNLGQWPVELDDTGSSSENSLTRAASWLAAFPRELLSFDAAVGIWHIRRTVDSPDLRHAWTRAHAVAEQDSDNPLRRFWNPAARSPAKHTSQWSVPGNDENRINTNRAVSEALHCRENGWRAETTGYIAGPMRDRGGYHTTHALWALHLAFGNGCVADGVYQRLVDELVTELVNHQPAEFEPTSTLDIDLYAERLLVVLMTRPEHPQAPQWRRRLLELQNADGSWGIHSDSKNPYYHYHATMAATWALTLYHRNVRSTLAD